MKRKIRLTESDLRDMVKKSVNKVLRESTSDKRYAAIKEKIARGVSMMDQIVQMLYELPDEEAQTFASELSQLLEGIDDYLAR